MPSFGGSENQGGYNTPNYQKQGGSELIIGSDITITGTINASGATAIDLPNDTITTDDIADDAITQAKLADSSVGTDQLIDASITSEKIVDEAIGFDQLGINAVNTVNIADGAILANKIFAGQIVTTKFATQCVTFQKVNAFLSTVQTGTGSEQNIPHGLDDTPSFVLVVPYDTAPATTGDYTCTEGTHTATDVVVTVTNGKKFKVFAWV